MLLSVTTPQTFLQVTIALNTLNKTFHDKTEDRQTARKRMLFTNGCSLLVARMSRRMRKKKREERPFSIAFFAQKSCHVYINLAVYHFHVFYRCLKDLQTIMQKAHESWVNSLISLFNLRWLTSLFTKKTLGPTSIAT